MKDTGDWKSAHASAYEDFYAATPHHPAMITCESKKYEPAKALAVCHYLQQTLVTGGKLISPNIATIHQAIKDGTHDLDCPYDWANKYVPRPTRPLGACVPACLTGACGERQARGRGVPRLCRRHARVPQGQDPRQEGQHRQVGQLQGRHGWLRRRHLRLSMPRQPAWRRRPSSDASRCTCASQPVPDTGDGPVE